jgi:hypothetical protein
MHCQKYIELAVFKSQRKIMFFKFQSYDLKCVLNKTYQSLGFHIINPNYSQILYLWLQLLKFIYNLKINTLDTSVVTCRHGQSSKKFELLMYMFPEAKPDITLSYFRYQAVDKCPFISPFSATFHILGCLLVILLLKMPSKCSSKVLCSVSKHMEAVMFLT